MNIKTTIFSLLLMGVGVVAFGQHLPGEPAVRKGRLDNGLTYYICHNELPAQRAEFYLATNVGAIQETPDQDGLAHFLEHMCFNGTKNFPDKGILNYLQSIGASFGGNVNASTGVEETVYMLNNIPLANATVVDSCLLVLHDWSHFVSCMPEEIDKERGVILEERRSRRDASWRLNEQARPFLYGDSKYASCSVIGSEDNLKNFKPESLTSFYKTWYRPDLQAVIVVGDIDVDEVETKISAIWQDIPASKDAKAKDVITIATNEKPAIGILTDSEFPNTNIAFYWKTSVTSEDGNDTAPHLVESLVKEIIAYAMNERLTDLASKPDSPFTQAVFSSMNVCETMDATALIAVPKEKQWEGCVTVAYTEAEKLRRFGLGESEYERAKTELLSRYETAANKASTRKNADFIRPLVSNFFDNHDYMSPQNKFGLVKGILPQLPLSMINDAAAKMISDSNMAVLYYGTAKEGVTHPTQDRIYDILNTVSAADIQQNQEQEVAASFLDPDSLIGSAIRKSSETLYDATELELDNGAKVILLPSDREKDKVLIKLVKKGGRSLISDEDLISFEDNVWTLFQINRGISRFPASEVKKMLSGKNVSAASYIAPYTHGVSATSTSKDIETAFQLAYLQYCEPRFDEAEYQQTVQMITPILANLENMPQFKFQKEAYKTMYDNFRHPLLSEEALQSASLETMDRVYRSLFNDAKDLVAFVVGDFDMDATKALVEKYVGSIPKGRKALKWRDCKDGVQPGTALNDFIVKMETPKVTVSQVYSANIPFSAKLDASLDALKYILDLIYTDTLREEEGGTYGAHVTVLAGQKPSDQDILEVDFETSAESCDKLRDLAKDGLKSLAKDGPSDDQFDKALKNLLKKIPENQLKNAYWLTGLEQKYVHGINYLDEYEQAIGSLTKDDVRRVASDLLQSGNFKELVMRPEAKIEQ